MSREQKNILVTIAASISASVTISAFSAFVSFKVLAARFEDYKQTNDERVLEMKSDIKETRNDVKVLLGRSR